MCECSIQFHSILPRLTPQVRPTNPETLVSLVQTINFASEGKTCALVRVSGPDSDMLAYALDAGKQCHSMPGARLGSGE